MSDTAEGSQQIRAASAAPVGSAIAVDTAEVRGAAAIRRTLPPVAGAT